MNLGTLQQQLRVVKYKQAGLHKKSDTGMSWDDEVLQRVLKIVYMPISDRIIM